MLLATSLPVALLGLWFLPAVLIVLLYLYECCRRRWGYSQTEKPRTRRVAEPSLPPDVLHPVRAGSMEVFAVVADKAGETRTLRWRLSMN